MQTLTLSSVRDHLAEALARPLPGARAHEPMRAVPIGKTIPNFTHSLPPKPGSVLILLYEHEGEICFPLIKRPDYTGAHSGQVSLPGGKAEPGETSIETALREGQEEIGVLPSQVEVIGRLSDFFVIPSNFLVTPVVAFANGPLALTPDPREVARILRGELRQLIAPGAVQTKDILAAQAFTMRAPHFAIEGEVVWGATAMMLNEFRTLLMDRSG
ncbi:MAG: CoA pyrophosphatase [Cyclobacteriaceae bacterium]|nr:CoA pyrophosphatase [Cyclobacteriaceae bacterium]